MALLGVGDKIVAHLRHRGRIRTKLPGAGFVDRSRRHRDTRSVHGGEFRVHIGMLGQSAQAPVADDGKAISPDSVDQGRRGTFLQKTASILDARESGRFPGQNGGGVKAK